MGDPGVPLVGHTLEFLHDGLTHARDYHERFGTLFWTGGFGIRMVSVLGPDGLETVLTNRDRAFSNKEGWDFLIGPFFDRGVMLMDFEEHRHHRRIMQQAFKHERLVAYLDKMNPAIKRGIARWQPASGFELYRATKQLTLDIATEVFVGGELGSEADRLNRAFIDCVVGGQAVIRADVPGGKWHRGLTSRRLLEDYFRAQIPAKRAGDGDDLFSVLCRAETEDGERFSDDDVVNHMIFTMMAAHDTSTITVAMMGYYLAKHPEWQERLREECRALGKASIGYEDLEALPTMDLVFKETLRHQRPGRIDRAPGDQGHRDRRLLHPEGHAPDALDLRHPADGAVVEEPRHVRPRALQRSPQGGCVAQVRVDPVRRRRPQVHRDALRRDGGQGDHAPAVAAQLVAGACRTTRR